MRLALQVHMEHRNRHLWKLGNSKIAKFPAFFRKLLRQRKTLVLVVENDPGGNLIGMAIGRVQYHGEFLIRRSGKIDDVWVYPPYRRRGVCHGLMAGLARHFRKHRVQLVTLVYALGNKEAEQTWKRFGFTPVLVSASAPLATVVRRSRYERHTPLGHS